jgi:hypothetical protein
MINNVVIELPAYFLSNLTNPARYFFFLKYFLVDKLSYTLAAIFFLKYFLVDQLSYALAVRFPGQLFY